MSKSLVAYFSPTGSTKTVAGTLAEAIGVDGETFAATMNAWNDCVANKTDAEFGRTSFANPLDTAPYYAIKVTAGVHHTMGGVRINVNAQVLDENGNVIPGLYAAGEVTGGIHGANRPSALGSHRLLCILGAITGVFAIIVAGIGEGLPVFPVLTVIDDIAGAVYDGKIRKELDERS